VKDDGRKEDPDHGRSLDTLIAENADPESFSQVKSF